MTEVAARPARIPPLFWPVAVIALGVSLVSYRYLLPGAPGGAPEILANRFTHLGALTLHAGLGATALMLGPLQFLTPLRQAYPRWHRRIGTSYVVCSLGAGAAGLVLACGTTAGPVAGLGFGLLAVAWLTTTFTAWRLARGGDFERHPRWMLRSYAVAWAAVTLRLYLPISGLMHIDFATAYRAIAWLCWIPNLLAMELYLALPSLRTSPRSAAASQSPG